MWYFIISSILLSNVHSVFSATCKTEANKTVDWYVAYKFPGGGNYAYILPTSTSWTRSKYLTNETGSMLYRTIEQAYKNLKGDQSFNAFYNDEKPEENEVAYSGYWFGHMKGVLHFDRKSTGFWLIHSTPKFPSVQKYGFPKTGLRFGQTFICVTLDYNSLGSIAKQLLVALPQVYSANLPPSIQSDFPDLVKVVHHKGKATVNKQTVTLKSSGGVAFTHFAKSVAFNSDLYASLVAPSLQVPVMMEGWRDGAGDMPSNCTAKYHVENIEAIKFSSFKVDFKTTKDHAKWCISKTSSQPWVCVGDINRQISQFRRGGGTMCFRNPKVWQQFNGIVSNVDSC